MLHSIAKITAALNIDDVANSIIERFYTNAERARDRFSRRFQILTYHKVSTDPHPFFAPTHPVVFEEHMQFLKRYYRVMPLAELVDRSCRGDVPVRAVAVTFDDGYRDNYEFAFPILKKYQLPATIFVATGVIGTGAVLWHDRIFDAFRFATSDSKEDRLRSLDSALNGARALYGQAQLKFVEKIEAELRPSFPSQPQHSRMLSWEQIREMYAAGIEFGSHTVTHPVLSRIPSEAVVQELRESKQELSERLGSTVVSFAYPNGRATDYNEDVKRILKECGYTCAVTTERGVNRAYADPFELKRGQPWHAEIESFRLRFFLERHSLAS